MEADKVALGYWNYRGRGQYLRHLLTHCNIPFEERIYANPGEWFTKDGDKTKLLGPMPFPNLPYLKHGDKYITETTAIAK